MIRDDFLMRAIKKLADAIGRIMKMAREGRAEEATTALEDETRAQLGMPGAMLDRLPPEQIVQTFNVEKSMIVAALLDADAELALLRGDSARVTERRDRADAIRRAAGLPVTR